MQNIRIEQTRDFIIDNFLYGDGDILKDHTSFMGEGIVDSTGILELITFLEMTYEIKIKDDEIIPENMDSLESISLFLTRKFSGQS